MAGKNRFVDLELSCAKCNKLCVNREVKRLHESRCTNDIWRDVMAFSARSYSAIGSHNLMAQPQSVRSGENSNGGQLNHKKRVLKKVNEMAVKNDHSYTEKNGDATARVMEQGFQNDHTYNTTSDRVNSGRVGLGIQNDHTYNSTDNGENNRNMF